MLTAIQGKFRNGKIELSEIPDIAGEADVVVTFLPTVPTIDLTDSGQMVTFGMLERFSLW
jgi:hypothetical protein